MKVKVTEWIVFARYIEIPDDTNTEDSFEMCDAVCNAMDQWTWDDAADSDGYEWEVVDEEE